MKQRIFLKNIPYEAKAIFATVLLSVLSLHSPQQNNNSEKEQESNKTKAKTFNLWKFPRLDVAETYSMSLNNNFKKHAKVDTELFIKNNDVKDTVEKPLIETDTEVQKKEKISTFNTESGVKIVVGKKYVKYIYKDGTTELREGGTLPWRNKNPGAIRKSGMAVAKANGFAVFASEDDGFEALRILLRGENYRNLTLKSAIFKYAPPHENNTTKYQSDIKRLTGVDLNRKLCDLNNEEFERVVKTIKQIEGWVPGKLTRTEASVSQKTITDTLLYASQRTR